MKVLLVGSGDIDINRIIKLLEAHPDITIVRIDGQDIDSFDVKNNVSSVEDINELLMFRCPPKSYYDYDAHYYDDINDFEWKELTIFPFPVYRELPSKGWVKRASIRSPTHNGI